MRKFRVLLCRMLLVLCAVSFGCYLTTGSVWTALAASLTCAVLLQIGYLVPFSSSSGMPLTRSFLPDAARH